MLPVSTAFEAKLNDTHRKIVKRVDLYDTYFAAPSNGIQFKAYQWTGDEYTDPDFSTYTNLTQIFPGTSGQYGLLSNLVLFWDTGTPFNINFEGERFAVEFYGYFYIDADESDGASGLSFRFAGRGITAQMLWGSGDTEILSATEIDTRADEDYTSATEITSISSGWYPFKIRIWGENGYENGGFTALYEYNYENDSYTTNGDIASLTGWAASGDYTIALDGSNYQSSPYGLKITKTYSDNSGAARNLLKRPIYENNTYTLTYKVKRLSGTATLMAVTPSGCWGRTETISGSWVTKTLTFTAHSTYSGSPAVSFRIVSISGTDIVVIDDVELTCSSYDDSYAQHRVIPLNAQVVNSTNSYLSADSLRGVTKIDGSKGRNEPARYTFELPYGPNGYLKDKTNNYYYDSADSTIILKEGKLVKIFAGYECDSTPDADQTVGEVSGSLEYIPRATVFIEGFEVNRGDETLTVNCKDALSLGEYDFCKNYPDAASYWSQGYLTNDRSNEPDGYNYPTAYDRWNFVKAVKDLLIRAGYPATLLYGKEYRHDSDGDVTETTELVKDNNYRLTEAAGYGTVNEEKYNYAFDYGTSIIEAVMKLVDTYGYRIAMREDGYLRLQTNNNATDKISGIAYLNYSSSGISDQTDDQSLYGSYAEISGQNNWVEHHFSGTGVSALMVRSTSSGPSDNDDLYWDGTASVQFKVLKGSDGSSVTVKEYNMYFSEEYFYRDGFCYRIGHNPAVIPIAQGLDYDDYILQVKVINGSYTVGVDEVWVYNYNFTEPVKTLGTYLSGTSIGTLSKIGFKRGIETLRNDVLVVGDRQGVVLPSGDVEQESEEHGANPTYLNSHARVIDVNSIYNPNVTNYVGRHIMTYIQEPSITSDDRARWLANSVLNNYREIKNQPDFTVIGDPQIEVGDCVAVLDKLEEDGTNELWITGLSESITAGDWAVGGRVSGVEPYPSYEKNLDMDISLFDNNYAINIVMSDSKGNDRGNGAESVLSGNPTYSSTTITVDDGTDFSSSGVVVVMGDSKPYYGIFEYTSKSGNDLTGSFTWYNFPTSYDFDDGGTVASAYNPYESDDRNNNMKLSFTCLVAGRVRVGVKKVGYSNWICGVSGGGGLLEQSSVPRWQNVWPGDELSFHWGGINESGLGYDDPTIDKKSGFYVDDGTYYYEIQYERDSGTKSTKIYDLYNPNFTDKDGVSVSSTPIYVSVSEVDKFRVDVGDYGRSDSVEYDQSSGTTGNDGGKISSTYAGWDIVNYIYVTSDETDGGEMGDIPLEMSNYYITSKRKYWIEVTPTVYKFSSEVDTSAGAMSKSFKMSESGGDPNPIKSSGDPVLLNSESTLNYLLNPMDSKWGVFDVDGDFYDEIDSGEKLGLAYWLVLRFDVRDPSGRKVGFVDSSGSEDVPAVEDMAHTANKKVWRKVLYSGDDSYTDLIDAHVELFWVPYAIHYHDVNSLTGYLRMPPSLWDQSQDFGYYSKHASKRPAFEPYSLNIPIKLCYTQDWWT